MPGRRKSRGWIGVDLDGTLARYLSGQGVKTIGEPVPAMIERVKRWLELGHEVRIVTARVDRRWADASVQRAMIRQWCVRNLGQVLTVQCEKDADMVALYDDRAVGVEKNTGRLLGPAHEEWPW